MKTMWDRPEAQWVQWIPDRKTKDVCHTVYVPPTSNAAMHFWVTFKNVYGSCIL